MTRQQQTVIHLTGNPNSGKTTLFNRLTGARQSVGNYPGVTVETVEGTMVREGKKYGIIDLPGTYSLAAHSGEESVTGAMLLNHRADLVVDVVDAANLERGLYLALQLKELGLPLVILCNKWDLVKGHRIDCALLSSLLGVPCLPVVGETGEGLDALFRLLAAGLPAVGSPLAFDPEIEEELEKISTLAALRKGDLPVAARWASIRLLEDGSTALDEFFPAMFRFSPADNTRIERSREHIRRVFGDDPHIVLTGNRYGQIRGILKDVITVVPANNLDLSDRLDRVFLNRFLGLPLFAGIMFLLFYIPFTLGAPLTDLLESAISSLGGRVQDLLPEGFWRSLVGEGVIGSVGGVLVFVPQIMLLFACLAFLEASGYMARAAFVVDRFMHKLGLHGKSFVPLIIGFGCTVPALMATRTLDSRRDRLATMLAIPFMSCSARLPVYTLFIGAFVPCGWQSGAMFALYLLGVLVAMATARFARKVLYRGEQSHLVMELPPYRVPTLAGVVHQMWMKAWHYLKKAGTIILVAGVAFWFLTNHPGLDTVTAEQFVRKQTDLDTRRQYRMQGIAAAAGLAVKAAAAETALTNAVEFRNIQRDLDRLAALEKKHAPSGSMAWLALQRDKTALKESLLVRQRWVDALLAWRHVRGEHEQALADLARQRIARERRSSVAGRVGEALSPLLAPAGLDNWVVSVSLLGGFIAKEVIVGTIGTLYGLGKDVDNSSASLRTRLLEDPFFLSRVPVSPDRVVKTEAGLRLDHPRGVPVARRGEQFSRPDFLVIAALLVFILLYLPCQAAVIVYAREVGFRHALLMITYTTGVAWLMAVVVFQGGRLLGL